MATTYATAAEVKTKNTSISVTHDDAAILELVEAASRMIDYETDKPEGFYGDAIPATVKAAAIYLALLIFAEQSAAGLSDERIGDRSIKLENPDTAMKRVRIILEQHNPPSLWS